MIAWNDELLTRKAERILRSADVICAPTGAAEAGSYALSIVEEFLEDHGYTVEVTCVNISKTRTLTEYKMFAAHNPVYVIAAWKGEE